MGYTTEFTGHFTLDRPLEERHATYLRELSRTRRMKRDPHKAAALNDPERIAVGLPVGVEGGYCVAGGGWAGQEKDASIIDYNNPPQGQPGLWCQWVPTDDLRGICWDQNEKFYNYVEWLEYIIANFLKPWGYKLNGEVQWQGEVAGDHGRIVANDNDVTAISTGPGR